MYVCAYSYVLIHTYVCMYVYLCILELKPTEVYLSRLFIKEYAVNWRGIGLELNLTSAKLNNIKADHPYEVKERCRTVLNFWLQRDVKASWGKLLNAIHNADNYRPSPSIEGTV